MKKISFIICVTIVFNFCSCSTIKIKRKDIDISNIVGTYDQCLMACTRINLKENYTFEMRLDGDLWTGQKAKGKWHIDDSGYITLNSDTGPKVIEKNAGLDGKIKITIINEDGEPISFAYGHFRCPDMTGQWTMTDEKVFNIEPVNTDNGSSDENKDAIKIVDQMTGGRLSHYENSALLLLLGEDNPSVLSSRFEWVADGVFYVDDCNPVELWVELYTPNNISYFPKNQDSDDFTFIFNKEVDFYVENERYKLEEDNLYQFFPADEYGKATFSDLPFEKRKYACETLFIDYEAEDNKANVKGQKLLEKTPELNKFAEYFVIEDVYSGYYSEESFIETLVWQARMSKKKEGSDNHLQFHIHFPIIEEIVEVGLTPEKLTQVSKDILSVPFMSEIVNSFTKAERYYRLDVYCAATSLNWRKNAVKTLIGVCMENGIEVPSGEDWIEFSLGTFSDTGVQFFHPQGTDLFFINPFDYLTFSGFIGNSYDCIDDEFIYIYKLEPHPDSCPYVDPNGKLKYLLTDNEIDWQKF